jgi:hypothetical protein
MLAASESNLVDRLLLLSYPLHPPQRPSELRTGHFSTLQTPAMFVHGTRDGFGTIDEVAAALKLIPARTELLPITGAGHELVSKRNREEISKRVVEAFRLFTCDLAPSGNKHRDEIDDRRTSICLAFRFVSGDPLKHIDDAARSNAR